MITVGQYSKNEPKPKYVWLAYEISPNIDVESLIECICDSLYEGAIECVSSKNIKELIDIVNNWL